MLRPCRRQSAPAHARTGLVVEANKRVRKLMDVVLTKPVAGLGKEGQVVNVSDGYFRNFLQPFQYAGAVTDALLRCVSQTCPETGEMLLPVELSGASGLAFDMPASCARPLTPATVGKSSLRRWQRRPQRPS